MANKTIDQLPAADQLKSNDQFAIQSEGITQSVSADLIKEYILENPDYTPSLENVLLSGNETGESDIIVSEGRGIKSGSASDEYSSGLYLSRDQNSLSFVDNNTQERSYIDQFSSEVSTTVMNETESAAINVEPHQVSIHGTGPSFRGLSSIQDYSDNLTELDFTQKIYVDSNFLKLSSYPTFDDNANITALSKAELNAAYGSAIRGFKVYCKSMADGYLVYEKVDADDWISYTAALVS